MNYTTMQISHFLIHYLWSEHLNKHDKKYMYIKV